MKQIAHFNIQDYVVLLGARQDMARLTASLDVAVSSSAYGEGFPNTLGEALCCAVPCISTNVGEGPDLARGRGWVVPIKDHKALSEALCSAFEMPETERHDLGHKGRSFMQDNYQINDIVQRYESHYLQSLGE